MKVEDVDASYNSSTLVETRTASVQAFGRSKLGRYAVFDRLTILLAVLQIRCVVDSNGFATMSSSDDVIRPRASENAACMSYSQSVVGATKIECVLYPCNSIRYRQIDQCSSNARLRVGREEL